jgi:hypothetical protein
MRKRVDGAYITYEMLWKEKERLEAENLELKQKLETVKKPRAPKVKR